MEERKGLIYFSDDDVNEFPPEISSKKTGSDANSHHHGHITINNTQTQHPHPHHAAMPSIPLTAYDQTTPAVDYQTMYPPHSVHQQIPPKQSSTTFPPKRVVSPSNPSPYQHRTKAIDLPPTMGYSADDSINPPSRKKSYDDEDYYVNYDKLKNK